MVRIAEARSVEEIEKARVLFREYAGWIKVDLCFQDFETELANLPGAYQAPGGCLLLAYSDDLLAGCVALRPFQGDICEMKRLFVRDAFRGMSIGKALATAAIARAAALGYSEMRLDTLSTMKTAQALYISLGFEEMAAYRFNPVEGAVYMRLKLR